MFRRTRLLALALLLTLAALAPLSASPANAATGKDVPVGFTGSHCYRGGKLAFMKVVVDNGGVTTIYGSTGTVRNVSPGKHTFVIQAWCRYGWVVGAGRSGSVCGWVYHSGYQPRINVFATAYGICN